MNSQYWHLQSIQDWKAKSMELLSMQERRPPLNPLSGRGLQKILLLLKIFLLLQDVLSPLLWMGWAGQTSPLHSYLLHPYTYRADSVHENLNPCRQQAN